MDKYVSNMFCVNYTKPNIRRFNHFSAQEDFVQFKNRVRTAKVIQQKKKAPDISVATEQDLTSPKSQKKSLLISSKIDQDVKSSKTNEQLSGISNELVHDITSPKMSSIVEQTYPKSKKQSSIITAKIEHDTTSQKLEKQMGQKDTKKTKEAIISDDLPLSTLVKINKQNEKKEAPKHILSPRTRKQQKMLLEQSNETSPTDLNQDNKLASSTVEQDVKLTKMKKKSLTISAEIEQPATSPKSKNIPTTSEHVKSPKSKKASDISARVAEDVTSPKLRKKRLNISTTIEQEAILQKLEQKGKNNNKQAGISDDLPLSTLVKINKQNETKEMAQNMQSPRTRNQQKMLLEQSNEASLTDLNQNNKLDIANTKDVELKKTKMKVQDVTSPKSKNKLPSVSAITDQAVKSPRSTKKASDISRFVQDVTSQKLKKKVVDISSSLELDVTSPKPNKNLPSVPVTIQKNIKSPRLKKKSPVISTAVEQNVTSPKSKKKTPDICSVTEPIVTSLKPKKRQSVNKKELATVFDNLPISPSLKINTRAATKMLEKDINLNTRRQQEDLSEKSNKTSSTDLNQIKKAVPSRQKRDRRKKVPDMPKLTTVASEKNDGFDKVKILRVENIKGPFTKTNIPMSQEPSTSLIEENLDSNSMPVFDFVEIKDQIIVNSGASAPKNPVASQIKIVPSVKRKAQATTNKLPSKRKKSDPETTEPLMEEETMPKDNIQLQNIPVVKGRNRQLQRKQARVRKESVSKPKHTSPSKQTQVQEKPKRSKTNTESNSLTLKEEIPYIAEGLKEDCEKLIEKCLQVYKLNFEKFSEVWKQMNFACIYYDRQSSAELAELSEEAIHVAKSHMVAKNTNFEKNVAGLFLVYALLNHQPYAQFASLRLVPQDVPAIKHLEIEARKQRRHDVIYVLGSVLIRGPCQFHVLEREVGLEFPIRKYWDGSIQNLNPTAAGLLTKSSELVGQFKNCQAIDHRLKSMHKKLLERNVDVKTFTSRQPAEALLNNFWRYVPQSNLSEEGETLNTMTSPSPEVDRHQVIRSLKARAMGNVVEPMRHLCGVNERLDKSLTPPSSSPNSSMESDGSPRRNKGKGKSKGRRYSAKSFHGLFDKDTTKQCPPELNPDILTQSNKVQELPDLSIVIDIEDNNEQGKESNSSINDDVVFVKPTVVNRANVNTDGKTVKFRRKTRRTKFDSVEIVNIPTIEPYNNPVKAQFDNANKLEGKIAEVVKNITNNNKAEEVQITEASKGIQDSSSLRQELDVRLKSIPIEIHNVNDNIEIEIIDNFDYKKDTESKEASANDKYIMGTEKQTDNAEIQSEPIPVDNPSNVNIADQLDAPKKKREKRDFKRIRIKSKLKKLGLLDVANFNVSEGDGSK